MGISRDHEVNENTPEQPNDKAVKVERHGNIALRDAFTALFGTPLVDSEMEHLVSIDKMPIYDNDELENPTYDQVVRLLHFNPLAP